MLGRGRTGERGQTLVEFALALPILFMLIFGLIDGGRAVFAYNSISRAAKEGVRYVSVYAGSQHGEFCYTCEGNKIGTYSGAGGLPLTYPNGLYGGTAPTTVGAVVNAATGLDTKEMTIQIESWVLPGGDPNLDPFSPGMPVRVTVTYTYKPATPFFSNVPIPLRSVATGRME